MTIAYDLAIIGGGPGGCAAAITAARGGARVLLFDKSRFPRHKVCGEFVSAESHDLLKSLLAGTSCKHLLHSPMRINSARTMVDSCEFVSRVHPPAFSIPRFDLDLALWNAAIEDGVTAYEATEATRVTGEGPFAVEANNGTFRSRSVIIASGRWSAFAETKSAPKTAKWIGLKAHFSSTEQSSTVDLYFFKGGYCGVQPVGEGRINVCAMVRAEIAATLEKVFQRHPRLLKHSRGWRQATETVSTSPLIFRHPTPQSGNKIYVGDAAGFIDPFVGDGISMALHSGAMATVELLRFCKCEIALDEAVHNYKREYERCCVPAFRNSARIRKLMSAPQAVRWPVLQMLKLPMLSEFVVEKTRAKVGPV